MIRFGSIPGGEEEGELIDSVVFFWLDALSRLHRFVSDTRSRRFSKEDTGGDSVRRRADVCVCVGFGWDAALWIKETNRDVSSFGREGSGGEAEEYWG